MRSSLFARRRVVLLILWLLALCGYACGGSGSSSGGEGTNNPPSTQPGQVNTPTRLPTRTPTGAPGASATVSSSSSPSPTASPTETGTPESSPTPTATPVIVTAGQNIAEAARRAPAGSVVVISPGSYSSIVLGPGELQDGVTLFADATGTFSESAPAPVTIDARGGPTGISLLGQSNVTLDGFTVRGATDAGVLLVGSPGATVRNCVVKRSTGDGIRMERSDSGLIFNNLVIGSGGTGIRLRAASGVRVINNTLYKNGRSGLAVGDSVAPSDDVEVTNNIIDGNAPFGIVVDPSTGSYAGNFNLNNDGYEGTSPSFQDIIGANPLFIFPSGDDFHLQAFAGGTTSAAVDAGDPDTDPQLVDLLTQLSTRVDGMPDSPPVDMGYHYASAPPTPTPRPRPTRTAAPTATPT